VVHDLLDRPAHVAEQLADLVVAVGEAPLGEPHLRVGGEQAEDSPSRISPPPENFRTLLERTRQSTTDRLRAVVHPHGRPDSRGFFIDGESSHLHSPEDLETGGAALFRQSSIEGRHTPSAVVQRRLQHDRVGKPKPARRPS
jgi:hypothetical protein